MFIYVAGPYLPHDLEPGSDEANRAIDANVERANKLGLELAEKGHTPFIPHTMMRNWENRHGLSRTTIESLCDRWLKRCDAFFLIKESPGAIRERTLARKLNLPIFNNVTDVPDGSPEREDERIDKLVFDAYLEEYKEGMESYRHIYATIWQAGSVLGAVGAALLAFGKTDQGTIPATIQALAPLPILIWYQGIYRPMNSYGEMRRKRLADLEELFRERNPKLNMQLFTEYNKQPTGNVLWRFIREPSVHLTVHLLGFVLLAFEGYLFAVHVAPPLLRYLGLVGGQ